MILFLVLLMLSTGCESRFAGQRPDTDDPIPVSDNEKDNMEKEDPDLDPALEVLYALVEANDAQDWPRYIDCYVNSAREDFAAFIGNPKNREEHLGLFDIKSAAMYEIKEMQPEDVMDYISVIRYEAEYGDVRSFYCGIACEVYEETKYYFSGVNYFLAAAVPEDGFWRIAELSSAPIEALRPNGLGFGSEAEGIALERFYELYPELRPEMDL